MAYQFVKDGMILYASSGDLQKIQELLGHATLAMASDIYTSVLLQFNGAYAGSIGELIPRAARGLTPTVRGTRTAIPSSIRNSRSPSRITSEATVGSL